MTTTETEVKFPTAEFFDKLVVSANKTLSDKTLGFAILKLGIEIVSPNSINRYVIDFDGYEINFDGQVESFDNTEVEAVVTGPQLSYFDMFKDIQQNSMATGSNTFNALTMAGFPLNVQGQDQVATDKVFRFAETIQHFLDSAHQMPTIVEQ